MPTYTNGNMPIFPQRKISDFDYPEDTEGSYSNWELTGRTQLLQDAPLKRVVPGEGNEPHGIQLSRWYTGTGGINQQPLSKPGEKPRVTYYHFGHLIWQGLPSAEVFKDGYGHLPFRGTIYSWYSNYIYDGLGTQNNPLVDPGHAVRYLGDYGVANTFGRTDPWDHQKNALAPKGPLENPGDTDPSDDYGKFGPKQWRGVASAKAL